MVNQVQDRNSLFSSNIQTFLQRRGQELAGVFLLFGSIVLSFIMFGEGTHEKVSKETMKYFLLYPKH